MLLLHVVIVKNGDEKSMWIYESYIIVESTKTTSMEDVSTGVLEKKKNI